MRRLSAYTIWLVLNFVGALSGALIFTVAAVYFVRDIGMNPLQLVLCGTVMELAIFLFEVPTGVLADTFSRRASVIVGTVVQGAAFVLVGAVQSVPAVLAGYAIWGLGWTFESGALQAWLADEVGTERLTGIFLRGARLGYAGALLGIGASVAIASSNLGLAIVIGGAVNVALGLFLVAAMPETGFRRGSAEAGEPAGAGAFLRTARQGARVVRGRPLLLVILAIAFFSGMWSESFDRLWEAHFLLLGLPSIGGFDPVVWFGVFGAGSMLIGLALTGPAASRLEHAGPRTLSRVLFAFEFFLLAAALAFALAGSFWLALGATSRSGRLGESRTRSSTPGSTSRSTTPRCGRRCSRSRASRTRSDRWPEALHSVGSEPCSRSGPRSLPVPLPSGPRCGSTDAPCGIAARIRSSPTSIGVRSTRLWCRLRESSEATRPRAHASDPLGPVPPEASFC